MRRKLAREQLLEPLEGALGVGEAREGAGGKLNLRRRLDRDGSAFARDAEDVALLVEGRLGVLRAQPLQKPCDAVVVGVADRAAIVAHDGVLELDAHRLGPAERFDAAFDELDQRLDVALARGLGRAGSR